MASAQAHGQKVRGHTLVWHSQLPAFISDGKFTKAQLNETVKQHIYTEVGHFKGKIYAWDVVNEALNEDGTMRESIFYKTLGEGYVADAFYWARTADPAAKPPSRGEPVSARSIATDRGGDRRPRRILEPVRVERRRSTAGLRVRGRHGVRVLDLDIDHEEVGERLMGPDVGDPAIDVRVVLDRRDHCPSASTVMDGWKGTSPARRRSVGRCPPRSSCTRARDWPRSSTSGRRCCV